MACVSNGCFSLVVNKVCTKVSLVVIIYTCLQSATSASGAGTPFSSLQQYLVGSQHEISRECMELVKRVGTNGA